MTEQYEEAEEPTGRRLGNLKTLAFISRFWLRRRVLQVQRTV